MQQAQVLRVLWMVGGAFFCLTQLSATVIPMEGLQGSMIAASDFQRPACVVEGEGTEDMRFPCLCCYAQMPTCQGMREPLCDPTGRLAKASHKQDVWRPP